MIHGKTTVLLLWLVLIMAAPLAMATTYLNSAPQDLGTAGETYIMSQNVTSAGAGYRITASNVTVDGANYTLTIASDYAVYTKVISPGMTGCMVKNLKSNGPVSLFYGGSNTVQDCNISGCTLFGSSSNIYRRNTHKGGFSFSNYGGSGSNYNLVQNSSFSANGDGAWRFIALGDDCDYNCFQDNTAIITNVNSGDEPHVLINYGADYGTIQRNSFTHTGTIAGFWCAYFRNAANNLKVLDNTFHSDQGGPWFHVGSTTGPHDNLFRGNKFFTGTESVKFYGSGTYNTTFQKNLMRSTNGPGVLYTDGVGSGNKFLNNTMYSASGECVADQSLV